MAGAIRSESLAQGEEASARDSSRIHQRKARVATAGSGPGTQTDTIASYASRSHPRSCAPSSTASSATRSRVH